ncbi:MAG: purine-nucleoside phosphorylase, partial [Coriobacteriales bacterium]|nr:purine-nucleoside phosphorylase [Coriobacteriales bacterium]
MTAYRAVQERVQQAVAALRPQLTATPQVALILGSGLGELAGRIGTGFSVSYADIPYFKASGAPSHAGRLVFGTLCGTQVVAMQGRVHGYEGNTPEEVVFPLQVMHALGARTLIVTNASGGINTAYSVGDLMLIADHINFT